MAKKKPAIVVAPKALTKTYGWKPDLPDHRDFKYRVAKPIPLPPSVDLRPGMPPVYDQGQLGSCTGNAIAAAIEFDLKRQKATDFVPSRLFIYYNERTLENDVGQDNGAQIRDGIKSVAKQGVTSEAIWPYSDANPGPFSTKPPIAAYADAMNHQVTTYMRVPQTLAAMKGCLAEGFPIVFGFTVYESFESEAVAKTGILPMPKAKEKACGGHAVLMCGYDDAKQMFLVRNSWAADWGDHGYFWMPYRYATNSNLADDLWTVRAIEQG